MYNIVSRFTLRNKIDQDFICHLHMNTTGMSYMQLLDNNDENLYPH